MKLILGATGLISVAWLFVACAPTHSVEMGAGQAPPGIVCLDDAVIPSSSSCDAHGGVADQANRDDSKKLTDR